MRIFSVTDRGLVREKNEDAFWMNGELGLFLVADGIGSTGRGVEASHGVVSACREALKGSPRPDELLPTLIRKSNARLYELAGEQGGSFGATTAILWIRGKEARYAWVGDSRIYRLRGSTLQRLTTDHTRAQELASRGAIPPKDAVLKSALTRSLGQAPSVEFDSGGPLDVQAGDLFMIATDGVTDLIDDEALSGFLSEGPIKGSGQIRKAVLAGGAPDNLTAILVEVEAPDLDRQLDAPQIASILQETAEREFKPSRVLTAAVPPPVERGILPFYRGIIAGGGKRIGLEALIACSFLLFAFLTPELLSMLGRRLESISILWFGIVGVLLYLGIVKLRSG